MKRSLVIGALSLFALPLGAQHVNKADTTRMYALQEVSVVGTRATKQTPMSYTNLTKKTLQRVNLGQDVPYLLQMQPSVVATSDAGTGIGYTAIRVRGVDATGINITANGVPINDSESQGVFWVNMPDLTSSVEEMQLQRGIGTSSNGAGSFGASLNMRTANLATQPYAFVSASGGSFGTIRANVQAGSGIIANHWAIDARVSKINSNGYIDRATVDLKSYFVQAGYFNDNTVLKFISFGGKERTGIAWNGISKSDEAKYGRTYNSAGDMLTGGKKATQYAHNTDNYQQIHNHLILTHRISPELSLNITGHYTAGYGFTDEFRTGRKLKAFGLPSFKDAEGNKVKKVSLQRKKFLDNGFGGLIANLHITLPRLSVTTGFSGNYYSGEHYGEIPFIVGGMPKIEPNHRYYESESGKGDYSIYFKANYNLTNRLSAFLDLQERLVAYQMKGVIDHYSDSEAQLQHIDSKNTFTFFNPKAGVFYQINPNHSLYASVAVANREPNRKMYTDIGKNNPSPKAEMMTDYELGYSYQAQRASVKANLYYMLYKDQLVANGKLSDVGELLLENIPDSYRLGLELSASVRPTDWLRLDGSLALSRNKIKNYTYNFSTYDADYNWLAYKPTKFENVDLAYSPKIVSSLGATFSWKQFELNLTNQYVGSQYLDNTASADRELPAYNVANLRVAYDIPVKRFIKNINLSLQVNNLLNAQYSSNGYVYDAGIDSKGHTYSDLRYFPQAGINFLAGTTISF